MKYFYLTTLENGKVSDAFLKKKDTFKANYNMKKIPAVLFLNC